MFLKDFFKVSCNISNMVSISFVVIINWGQRTIAEPKGLQIRPLFIDSLAILSPIDNKGSKGYFVFLRIKPSDVNIDESELKEFLDEHENYFSELISEYIKKLKAISSS